MARNMTDHVPITPELKKMLQEFREGTGGTYDDAIRQMLEIIKLIDPDLKSAGAKLKFARQMNMPIDPPKIKGIS